MSWNKRTSDNGDLAAPGGATDVLLLVCCAPCSGEPLRAMGHGGIRPVVYFYNPNIHPRAEYERRRDCMRNYCEKMGIEFIEGPYDSERWFARTAGMEAEPERGRRCGECFAMRLERAAKFAAERGLDVMACTLGISRFKDMDQVNAAGRAAALGVEGVEYWPQNWRKGGGSQRMYEISREEFFYMQEYCGCKFSRAEHREAASVEDAAVAE